MMWMDVARQVFMGMIFIADCTLVNVRAATNGRTTTSRSHGAREGVQDRRAIRQLKLNPSTNSIEYVVIR